MSCACLANAPPLSSQVKSSSFGKSHMDYVIPCLGRDSVPSNPFLNRTMKGTGILKDNSRASIRILEPRESWKMEKHLMVSDRHVPKRRDYPIENSTIN